MSRGGSDVMPTIPANEAGLISGKTRFKSEITCLWTLADPVWSRLNKSSNKSFCKARYCLPTVEPLKAKTIDNISKQYASDGISPLTEIEVDFEHRSVSQSSRNRIVSTRMAWTMCEQTCLNQ